MDFSEAVRDGLSKYATFSGRSSRAAYWWFYLFTTLVFVAALAIDAAVNSFVFYALAFVVLFLPGLAVLVRRFHDSGHSGWWALTMLVPIVGFFVWLIFCLTDSDGPNEWGERPDVRYPTSAPGGPPAQMAAPPPPPPPAPYDDSPTQMPPPPPLPPPGPPESPPPHRGP